MDRTTTQSQPTLYLLCLQSIARNIDLIDPPPKGHPQPFRSRTLLPEMLDDILEFMLQYRTLHDFNLQRFFTHERLSLQLPSASFLSANILKTIPERCPNLTELDLSGCSQVTSGVFYTLCQCTNLRRLDLSRTSLVDPEALELGAKILTGIRILCLRELTSAVNDSVLATLSQFCREIEVLDISGCRNLTQNGMYKIAYFTYLRHKGFPNLTTLSMANMTTITDSVINMITSGHISLRSLDISGSFTLTNSSLRSIATNSGTTSLSFLDISGNFQYTDAGIETLSRLTRLSHLRANGCSGVSPMALLALCNISETRYEDAVQLKRKQWITNGMVYEGDEVGMHCLVQQAIDRQELPARLVVEYNN